MTSSLQGKVLHGVKPGMPVLGVAPLMAMKSLTDVSLRSVCVEIQLRHILWAVHEAMGSFELFGFYDCKLRSSSLYDASRPQ